ncbi:hypothetical protein [Streptomyces sp. UG1]|uniref:hypothetical protein n=1 Tax=Streptomyces sp. UG1 TaxID=3417652 RepID=UPI003CF9AFF1
MSDLLRGHLKKIGSMPGTLPPSVIITIVLAVPRHDHRLAEIAGGSQASASTVRRWLRGVLLLLPSTAIARRRGVGHSWSAVAKPRPGRLAVDPKYVSSHEQKVFKRPGAQAA